MGNWEFYDEGEEIDGGDDAEPSFSLHDFKKWLASQKDDAPGTFRESVEVHQQANEEVNKDALKEAFKNNVRTRVQRNIDRKLAERKKKKS